MFMKKIGAITIAILLLIMFITSSADSGPKPVVSITVTNLSTDYCFIGLMVPTKNSKNTSADIDFSEPGVSMDKKKLYDFFINYTKDGWSTCIPFSISNEWQDEEEFIVPENGVAKTFFDYSLPLKYKIIVVSSEGNVYISESTENIGIVNKVLFDVKTQNLINSFPLSHLLIRFVLTSTITLLIEVIVLFAFGFAKLKNFKPFFLINILTQIMLYCVISAYYLVPPELAVNFNYWIIFLFGECLVILVESLFFVKVFKQHTVQRRVLFASFANFFSLTLGYFIMSNFTAFLEH